MNDRLREGERNSFRGGRVKIKFVFLAMLMALFFMDLVASQEVVGVSEPSVCCQETKSGLFCQDVLEEDCASEQKSPTACRSTSFCNPGYCFDSEEGTCMENTPLFVCNQEGGTWTSEKPAQCDFGCCALGDQASFVTLTRCKRLSGFFGLETSWNPTIKDQTQCLLSVRGREKGACVYREEFETTCKITTREECNPSDIYGQAGTGSVRDGGTNNLIPAPTSVGGGEENNAPENANAEGTAEETTTEEVSTSPPADGEVQFYPGKLCTAEELGTNCAPTRETICQTGKEEVYFVDTCGNPANVYDASKISNDEYWANMKDKSEVCNPNSANEDSQTCGNCNYLLGSYCRTANSETANPTYGENICQSLNCEDLQGNNRLHGESWCVYDANVLVDSGINPVGSKFYRHLCLNGKINVEPCADFRQEECIQNTRETAVGSFTEAACRVNRWQDCTAQTEKAACENGDRRDCKWLDGIEYILMGAVLNGTSLDTSSLVAAKEQVGQAIDEGREIPRGACVAQNPPGLRFWEGEEAAAICGQANAACPVTYEKGLVGGDWECVKNCQCLEDRTELKRKEVCAAMGDCGLNVNFVGVPGSGKGIKISEQELKKKKD